MNLRVAKALQAQLRPEALAAGFVALAALGLLAAWLYLLKPAVEEYRTVADESSEQGLLAAVESAPQTAAAIARLERETADLRDRLYGGASGVPLREMQAWVIHRLDQLSLEHGVELESVSPGEVGHVLMFDELPYDVRVRGGYFALFAWLNQVEQELRPMSVQSFEIRPEPADAAVEMEFRLVSYRPTGGAQ